MDQKDADDDGSGDACDCFPINHCFNDGECEDDYQNFTCSCTLGFTGALCDADIDECNATSCADGATCVDLVAMTRCACPSGYWGIRCELSSNYTATVHEVFNGSFVKQVTPTDLDEFSTSVFHHEITSGNDGGLFFIDRFSGNVTTSLGIDRETADVHVLTVVVREPRNDPPLVARTTTATITVHIDDVNDNAPVFVDSEWNATISKSYKANTVVTRVTATDRDIGSNAKLMYSIVPGAASDYFWIDPFDGTVLLSRSIPWSDQLNNITIWINATDEGLPSQSVRHLAAVHVCPSGYIGQGCTTGELRLHKFSGFTHG